jgi:hypothetical protein
VSANPDDIQQHEQRNHDELLLLLLLYGRTREQLLRDGVLFLWDENRHRYWDLVTENIISPNRLRVWVDAALARTENRIDWLTRRLINGNIDYPTWATLVQPELKAMHTGLAEIAIGGRSEWNATMAGRLGVRMRMLYQRLNDLGLEWERGEVSDAQILNRIGMAVQSGRGTFEGMIRGMMMDAGATEEMRVLGAAAHCEDCPPISGFWAEIGTLPGIGDSACLSNCACTFVYKMPDGSETEGE